MKTKINAFAAMDAQPRQRDLSPTQCRAGRALLGWDEDDLADKSGLDVQEIEDFEARDEHYILSICERFKLWEAFHAEGVTFYRGRTSEGVQISRGRSGPRLYEDGISPSQVRAALALLDWDLFGLADISGVSAADVQAFERCGELPDADLAQLVEALRAAGVNFYTTTGGQGVWVKCRRPWYRAWLDRRAFP